jgi:hypothetical protein
MVPGNAGGERSQVWIPAVACSVRPVARSSDREHRNNKERKGVGRTNRKLIKPSRSKQLRTRAVFCKSLAVAVGNPRFAAMLRTLAAEYESEAERAAQVETPDMPRRFEEIRSAFSERHTD